MSYELLCEVFRWCAAVFAVSAVALFVAVVVLWVVFICKLWSDA